MGHCPAKGWDQRYGLVLRGVFFDGVEAESKSLPAGMDSFVEEVYRFCPDLVEQGTNSVSAPANQMRRQNALYLWWD